MTFLLEGWKDVHEAAEALSTALREKGLVTIVHKSGGHLNHPCVEVDAGRHRLVPYTVYIYIAPDDADVWWFWWSLGYQAMEPVALATEVSFAADVILRAIAAIPKVGVRVL